MCRNNDSDRLPGQAGAALLVTLGVLTLLLSFGSAFVFNMISENHQTEEFIRGLQARLSAQAGLERAIAELRLHARKEFVSHSGQPWYWNGAAQPSYQRRELDDADGEWKTYPDSGRLDSGARYTLKISDASSRIHLNDDNPRLSDMLENLPRLGAALSKKIIQARTGDGLPGAWLPHGRYVIKEQLKLVKGIGEDTFDAVKNCVTVEAYQDSNTMDLAIAGSAQPYVDAVRSPIGVNTASREVLAAVLEPVLSSLQEAGQVADDLMGWTGAGGGTGRMEAWQDYEAWRGCVADRIVSISAAEDKNLRDNFNPNRKHAWKKTSAATKSQKFSTEFCFHSGGVYEVESTGEVLDTGGRPAASATVSCTVRIFNLVNFTKREQFRGEDANGNFTMDPGEDSNGNGVLDQAEFRNVTWADDCPVNSSDETDLGYVRDYGRVNDALKLGFWDDFEDGVFSRAVWQNLKAANGSSFAIENSDTQNLFWEKDGDNELHHATTL